VVRHAKEITEEVLFQPVAAKLCAQTFRVDNDNYGPDPIDALRGSVAGDGA
jgi:hypothetical protein